MSQLDVAFYLEADAICGCDRKAGGTRGKYLSGSHMSLLVLRSLASQQDFGKKPLDLIHDPLNWLHTGLPAFLRACRCQGTGQPAEQQIKPSA